MITKELKNQTWRFIQTIREKNIHQSEDIERAKRLYKKTLQKLGYSEFYIQENCERIENCLNQSPDSVQAPLLHLQEKAMDVWLVETLKKQLLAYLVNEKKLDIANALYIVAQYVSLDGRNMIRTFAHTQPKLAKAQ